MLNYVGDGEILNIVPLVALTSGVPKVIGGLFVVPQADIAANALGAVVNGGEFTAPKATGFVPAVGDVAYWDVADAEFNSDTGNTPVGHYTVAAATGDTVCQVKLLPTPVASVASLTARLGLVEREFGFTGAGDTATMSDTAAHVFTSKATVPATADGGAAVEDWCEWECEILISGAVATPQVTCKLLLGTAELDSQVIATAAANDGVVIKGRGRITGATTMRVYKGLGYTKDGTVAYVTPIAPADLTIQALTTARDVTASVTSGAGDAGNTAVIKSLRFGIKSYAA